MAKLTQHINWNKLAWAGATAGIAGMVAAAIVNWTPPESKPASPSSINVSVTCPPESKTKPAKFDVIIDGKKVRPGEVVEVMR